MGRSGKMKARARRQGDLTKPRAGLTSYGLTMLQEARNTEGRNRSWSTSHLRHKAISFVGANDLRPESSNDSIIQELNDDRQKLKTTLESAVAEPERTADGEYAAGNPTLFVDLSGENVTQTGLPDPVPRLSSPTFEESSDDEIIVFRGRNRHEKLSPLLHDQSRPVGSESALDCFEYRRDLELRSEAGLIEPAVSSLHIAGSTGSSPSDIPTSSGPPQAGRSVHVGNTPDVMLINEERRSVTLEDEVDIMADYIANIDRDYAEPDILRMEIPESGGIDVNNFKIRSRSLSATSDSSAGADYFGPMQSISIEEANELHAPHSESSENWTGPSGDRQLGGPGNYSNSDLEFGDEFISSGCETDLQDFEDSESGVKGCSSDRPRPTQNRSRKQPYLSASSFADALEFDPYYGLDIMDFNRPSLRKKTKGKRHVPDLAISDSELELELQKAWQNDREKKKSKKQKREELRSQGLLGRSAAKPDLKMKYSDGMSIDDLKLELRLFLLSSKETLSLPPMNKQHRKIIHDLANALSLKSQSRGNGSSRFPILYKTSRTPKYTSKTIFRFEKMFSGAKFSRRTAKVWDNQASTKSVEVRRGRLSRSVSYMDGDVVGASAPEIGAENKGRAMLEKMGWSTGTALGAVNNKGILQPVAHVVKNSRVGLG